MHAADDRGASAQGKSCSGAVRGRTLPTPAPPEHPVKGFVQHGLPLALAALTAFGIAGYAVGGADLEGWYAAAGASVLTFNWDIQYVVLRGLSADVLDLWMLFLLAFAGLIVLFSGVESLTGWLFALRDN